jgi:signal transduction histidine kinase
MVQGGLCAEFISDAVPAHSNYTFAHYWEEGRQLFLATDAKGFYQIRQPLVQQLTEPRYGDPTLSKATYSQILLSSGNIITQSGQIFGEHPQNKGPDWFGRGNIGRNVHIHPNGKDLLFSCQDILYHCSGRTDSCRPLFGLHGLAQSAFYPLGEELWIAYRGSAAAPGGFLRFRKDSIEHRYTFDKPRLELPHFYQVFPWDGNQFAVATCSGLWLVDTLSRRLDTLPGTEGLCIRTTWRYKDYLFLGTYGDGIWVYRNGRLTVLPLDPKKHLLHAHCFQPDAYGFVWISTNHGLFRVHLDDLLDAADGLDQQVFYRYFGLREGMSLTEMNGGCNPCALELPDGRLSFPTMDGLLWVDPAKVSHTFTQPGPYFGSVQAGEYEYAGRPEIRFPGPIREATIQLEYSYFGNSENNYLYYRLLPDQPEWALVDARSPHELRLTGLPPGTHRLQLKKLNGYDLFAQRELTLHIPYPWYMSWYAFLLYATGLGLAIWVISKLSTVQYQRRQRELEARIAEKTWEVKEKNSALEENIRQLRRQQTILNQVNQLKNRLVSILNHDIITPLRFLHLTGRNLVQNKDRMPGELQEELLTEIAHTAEELQHLSTNILNWVRYQDLGRPELVFRKTNLYELAEQVKKLLAAPARSKGTRIVNAIPPGALVHIPAEPFQIMLYNLVSNSLKFTQGGEIELGIQQGEDSWNLYVRDTGQGMSKAQVDNILHSDFVHSTAGPDQVRGHGLGFLIIRELVQLMGGRLKVESEPGRGTAVVIALPARPGESVPGGPLVRRVLPSEKG